jgi:hypothetical protein
MGIDTVFEQHSHRLTRRLERIFGSRETARTSARRRSCAHGAARRLSCRPTDCTGPPPAVFTTLGLLLRSPSAVINAGFLGIFLRNVFVDPQTLPSALEAFVDVNPISILATASRGLMEGSRWAGTSSWC